MESCLVYMLHFYNSFHTILRDSGGRVVRASASRARRCGFDSRERESFPPPNTLPLQRRYLHPLIHLFTAYLFEEIHMKVWSLEHVVIIVNIGKYSVNSSVVMTPF